MSKSVFRVFTSVVIIGLHGCQQSAGLREEQKLSEAESLYASGRLEDGDAIFSSLLASNLHDVVILSRLRELIRPYNRNALFESASTQLRQKAEQLKVLEVARTLRESGQNRSAIAYLDRADRNALPKPVSLLLKATAEIGERDYRAGLLLLEELQQSPNLEPELQKAAVFLQIRANRLLGNSAIAEGLRLNANRLFPNTTIFDRAASERIAALAGQPALPALPPVIGSAEQLSSRPEVCRGRSVLAGIEIWGALPVCEKGAAMIGVHRPMIGLFTPADEVPILGYCCKLPGIGIFSDSVTYAASACPENTVVTAAIPRCTIAERLFADIDLNVPRCRIALECVQINSARYRLGEPEPGIHWGDGSVAWLQKRSIPREAVPYAMRAVLGRINAFFWTTHGCMGSQNGSLLVKKSGKHCHQLEYRRLFYQTDAEATSSETPVPLFPQCLRRVDPFAVNPECEQDDSNEQHGF